MEKNILQMKGLVACILALVIAVQGVTVYGGTNNAATMDQGVEKSLGKDYPFSSQNEVTSSRRLFGITARKLKSYKAYEKVQGSGSNRVKYMYFVGYISDSKDVSSVKKDLKQYILNEANSMESYLGPSGKKMFKNVRYGSKGNWVWALVLKDSATNKKAEKAIKQKI